MNRRGSTWPQSMGGHHAKQNHTRQNWTNHLPDKGFMDDFVHLKRLCLSTRVVLSNAAAIESTCVCCVCVCACVCACVCSVRVVCCVCCVCVCV